MANTICLTYTVDLYCIHTVLTVQEKFRPQFFFVSSVNKLISVKRLITRELTPKGHVDLNQQCGNEGGVFMTFFIGIDIAKYKHDGFILDHAGEVIREAFSFTNDRSSFACLKEILSTLDSNQMCRIGFESTGHYAMNLKIFFRREWVHVYAIQSISHQTVCPSDHASENQNRQSWCACYRDLLYVRRL